MRCGRKFGIIRQLSHNGCEKKGSKKQRRKERYTHLNAVFQRIARREKKAFLSDQHKKKRKTTEWERLDSTEARQGPRGLF